MVIFERVFGRPEFDMEATDTDVTAKTGQFTIIGTHTVGAQQLVAYGAGNTDGGVDTRELVTIDIEDTGSLIISGKIRLAVQDANGTQTIPVVEDLASNWRAGTKKLANTGLQAKEDSKLLIQLNPDVNDTVVDMSDANTDIKIPVTVQTL